MKGLNDPIEKGEGGANVQVPANLAVYVDTLGHDKAMELLLELGGAHCYFADDPTFGSIASSVIGQEAVSAIGRALKGGPRTRVPTAKVWISRYLYAEGWSISAIARKLHMTDVTVRKYIRAHKTTDRTLFDFAGI